MVPCKRVAQVKNSFVQNFVETHVWTSAHVAPALVRGGSSGDVAKWLFAQARGVLHLESQRHVFCRLSNARSVVARPR